MTRLNPYPKFPRVIVPKPKINEPDVEQRLKRIEARLVQLMLHVGLDPYKQTYHAEHPDDKILLRHVPPKEST